MMSETAAAATTATTTAGEKSLQQDQVIDKDKDKGSDKNKDKGSDKDETVSEPSVLALVPQVHADSCHYCAGGLFRAANLLLADIINHRQRCPYT